MGVACSTLDGFCLVDIRSEKTAMLFVARMAHGGDAAASRAILPLPRIVFRFGIHALGILSFFCSPVFFRL
jgi:hypothetical protein